MSENSNTDSLADEVAKAISSGSESVAESQNAVIGSEKVEPEAQKRPLMPVAIEVLKAQGEQARAGSGTPELHYSEIYKRAVALGAEESGSVCGMIYKYIARATAKGERAAFVKLGNGYFVAAEYADLVKDIPQQAPRARQKIGTKHIQVQAAEPEGWICKHCGAANYPQGYMLEGQEVQTAQPETSTEAAAEATTEAQPEQTVEVEATTNPFDAEM